MDAYQEVRTPIASRVTTTRGKCQVSRTTKVKI